MRIKHTYSNLSDLLLDVFEAIGFWYLLVAAINSSVSLLWVRKQKG
jgi:hypothetical protein